MFTALPVFALLIAASPQVSAQTIVINEIMQNPSAVADGSGEWFELYNPGTRREDSPLFSWLYLHRTARNLATSARGSRSEDASRTASSDDASEEERAEASRADASADARWARRASTDEDVEVISARMSRATSAAARGARGVAPGVNRAAPRPDEPSALGRRESAVD